MELESFAPAFAALHTSASLTCLTSGKTISGLSVPTLAIVDVSSFISFQKNTFKWYYSAIRRICF